MGIAKRPVEHEVKPLMKDLVDGFRYCSTHPTS